MINIEDNPAFKSPVEELKNYFSSGDGFLEFDTHLCFVCGANGRVTLDGKPSLRFQFLSFIGSITNKRFIPVQAEKALEEFSRESDEQHVNLSHFEEAIGQTVNSILIFPESPGSFAEVGLFSGSNHLAKKTLIACREAYQGTSFLTIGPIHYLASVSTYRPLPIVVGEEEENAFYQITERLLGYPIQQEHHLRKRRKRLPSEPIKNLEPRAQIAVIQELISICGILTEEDFKFLLGKIFGKYDISTVRHQLALLVAMNRIQRSEGSDLIVMDTEPLLLEFPAEIRTRLQGKWHNAYLHEAPDFLEYSQMVLCESH